MTVSGNAVNVVRKAMRRRRSGGDYPCAERSSSDDAIRITVVLVYANSLHSNQTVTEQALQLAMHMCMQLTVPSSSSHAAALAVNSLLNHNRYP